MKYIHLLSFVTLSFMLCSCSYLKPSSTSQIEHIYWQEQQPNCSAETLKNNNCPTITFSSLKFKKNQKLNMLINHELLQILDTENTSTVDEYLQSSLVRANDGYRLTVSVELMSENNVLTVILLTVEEIPSTDQYKAKKFRFINFDQRKQKNISVNDMVASDKIESFWSTAQLAYKQWLEIQQLLNNQTYQQNWPFVRTNDIALLPKQLLLKYKGNTLAPYAMGEPTLFIPYQQLNTILKPEYLPH